MTSVRRSQKQQSDDSDSDNGNSEGIMATASCNGREGARRQEQEGENEGLKEHEEERERGETPVLVGLERLAGYCAHCFTLSVAMLSGRHNNRQCAMTTTTSETMERTQAS